MWHLDFVHRHINRSSPVTLILIDDHSRFVTGHGVNDAERAGTVVSTFERAVERHGRPARPARQGLGILVLAGNLALHGALDGDGHRTRSHSRRSWSMVTNRAGNFYIEGEESAFVYPYRVELSWLNPISTPPGLLEAPQMATMPRYGGCARCHGVMRAPEVDFVFDLNPANSESVNPQPLVFIPSLGPGESPF